jgi:ketosteroid isomerase-like protein
MSANLDLVRSIYAAWERGDFSSAAWADPQIAFASPVGVETGSWTGVAEMAKVWRETMSAYEELRVRADEYRELDDDRVLVLTRSSGRGKTSGLELGEMRTHGATLFQLRGGKVTRLVVYTDRASALADLGLTPETGSQR